MVKKTTKVAVKKAPAKKPTKTPVGKVSSRLTKAVTGAKAPSVKAKKEAVDRIGKLRLKIGKFFEYHRLEAKLQQGDVAAEVGMSASMISQAENGLMSMNVMLALIAFYGLEEAFEEFFDHPDADIQRVRKANAKTSDASPLDLRGFQAAIDKDPNQVYAVKTFAAKQIYKNFFPIAYDDKKGQWYATSREHADLSDGVYEWEILPLTKKSA